MQDRVFCSPSLRCRTSTRSQGSSNCTDVEMCR